MQLPNKKTPVYILYILGSLLFISIPVFSSPDFNTARHLFDVAPFKRIFLSYILLLLFFYANYLFLLPKLYFSKKQFLYFCCIITAYFVVATVPAILIHSQTGQMPLPPGDAGAVTLMPTGGGPIANIPPMGQNSSLFTFLLVLVLGYLLKINQRLVHIQNEKLKAEVAYLKAQINPHFLFNTLNSVYALTLEKSDAAPQAVLKLSSMMRYVVTESSRDQVSLEKEIEYVKNFISLQQLRMDSATAFSFVITGNPLGKSISPLTLIPFIENAFKYGINPEEKSDIEIKIDITAHDIALNVKNSKVSVHVPSDEKTEQGIENTRQRLAYLYPNKHNLIIFEDENAFTVNLLITLE